MSQGNIFSSATVLLHSKSSYRVVPIKKINTTKAIFPVLKLIPMKTTL